jgi:hypothetical protein
LERSTCRGNKKGPCGPDGFAIHLRKTGLDILWRNDLDMSSINFGSLPVRWQRSRGTLLVVGLCQEIFRFAICKKLFGYKHRASGTVVKKVEGREKWQWDSITI